MNREQKLFTQSVVHDVWVAKYEKVAGFNSENPTSEQEEDYFSMLMDAYGKSKQD